MEIYINAMINNIILFVSNSSQFLSRLWTLGSSYTILSNTEISNLKMSVTRTQTYTQSHTHRLIDWLKVRESQRETERQRQRKSRIVLQGMLLPLKKEYKNNHEQLITTYSIAWANWKSKEEQNGNMYVETSLLYVLYVKFQRKPTVCEGLIYLSQVL